MQKLFSEQMEKIDIFSADVDVCSLSRGEIAVNHLVSSVQKESHEQNYNNESVHRVRKLEIAPITSK